jgi:polyisoprenoid-binding protein YceI
VLLTLHGILSMRGTERPVSFMGRVRLRQGTLWVRGENRIRPADFGIPPLRSWLISMKEHVLATFDLVLSKAK